MKTALRIFALTLAVGACVQVVLSYASVNVKAIKASPIHEGGSGEPGI